MWPRFNHLRATSRPAVLYHNAQHHTPYSEEHNPIFIPLSFFLNPLYLFAGPQAKSPNTIPESLGKETRLKSIVGNCIFHPPRAAADSFQTSENAPGCPCWHRLLQQLIAMADSVGTYSDLFTGPDLAFLTLSPVPRPCVRPRAQHCEKDTQNWSDTTTAARPHAPIWPLQTSDGG